MTSAPMFQPREQDIVHACLDVLRLRGCFAYRQNQGGMTMAGKTRERFVRFTSITGVSDIIGLTPGGRFIAIEVKRPGNVPTPDQQEFLNAVRRRGGLALVVTDASDLAEIIDLELTS